MMARMLRWGIENGWNPSWWCVRGVVICSPGPSVANCKCNFALFNSTSKSAHQQTAIAKMEEALKRWHAYAAAYTKQYEQPLLYNRVGWVDIPKLAEKAAADIQIARDWKPGSVKYRAMKEPVAAVSLDAKGRANQ